MSKIYVVLEGHNPGIYNSWTECKKEVEGFKNAKYKSFKSLEEAKKEGYILEEVNKEKHSFDLTNSIGLTNYELAEQIGNLSYDGLSDFFLKLSKKLEKDSYSDDKKGRNQLASLLQKSSLLLQENTNIMEKTWKLCKPYMNNQFENKGDIKKIDNISPHNIKNAIFVDGACSGNPGLGEYRGVHSDTNEVMFHLDGFNETTNNIMEFFALVDALMYVHKSNSDMIIYSDSQTAISWVKNCKVKTTLKETKNNQDTFLYIQKFIQWLKENKPDLSIIHKWNTKTLGEIPADFCRK